MIGDNPALLRQPSSGDRESTINFDAVEITMPLGSHLCLRLDHRGSQPMDAWLDCGAEEARELNTRQREAATRCVYGNSAEILMHETVAHEMAR